MNRDQLADLLQETGAAHHQAYLDTDGADPEWPIWYADYLQPRLATESSSEFTKAELIHRLVQSDKDHVATDGAEHWTKFYASQLLAFMGLEPQGDRIQSHI